MMEALVTVGQKDLQSPWLEVGSTSCVGIPVPGRHEIASQVLGVHRNHADLGAVENYAVPGYVETIAIHDLSRKLREDRYRAVTGISGHK